MSKNPLFSVTLRDALKGVMLAVVSTVLIMLYGLVQNPDFTFSSVNWYEVLRIAMASGLGYIVTNFFSSGSGSTEKTLGVPVGKLEAQSD